MSRVGSGECESVLPHELDQLLLELASEWDNCVKVIGPDDHHAFITLHGGENESKLGNVEKLTMNAPHCSLSALGNMLMESTI